MSRGRDITVLDKKKTIVSLAVVTAMIACAASVMFADVSDASSDVSVDKDGAGVEGNIAWKYVSATGTLTISLVDPSGDGTMYGWSTHATPWDSHRTYIKHVVVEEGVTTIGYCAFLDCVNLKDVKLPSTLKTINIWSFANCKSLKSITIPASVTKIGGEAFRCAYDKITVYNLSSLNLQPGKCGLSMNATVINGAPPTDADVSDVEQAALTSVASYAADYETIVVSFNVGDYCIALIAETVGECYILPDDPVMLGFVFDGWYDSDDNLITEETIVQAGDDLTLTAKWIPAEVPPVFA